MSTSQETNSITRKILYFPLTRIVIGVVVCGLAMLATNSILKIVLGSEGDVVRIIRWLLSTTALLTAYYFLFKLYEKREVTELSKTNLLKEGLLGLSIGVLSISVVVLVFYVLGYYQVLSANSVKILLLTLLFYVTAAALEETVFRGVLYRIVENSLGTNLALIISALLFGLIHVPNENANVLSLVSATSGGLLLGLMFSLTRRLWLPIAFHAGWNWALASHGTVVSGVEGMPTFLQIKMNGPELITGGSFGPENSILTIGIVLIISGVSYYLLHKKGKMVKRLRVRQAERASLLA
jgi:membrane protease YdiL (CAAX protease family)